MPQPPPGPAVIFNAIDSDGNGAIDPDEFFAFLTGAKKLLQKREEDERISQDPRNYTMLVQSITSSVGSDVDIMVSLVVLFVVCRVCDSCPLWAPMGVHVAAPPYRRI